MQSSMATIPEDVIIEILCRLPVLTLLRFRCVSKRFRSIIDDPDFINRHLQNHRSLNRRKLIVQGILPNLFSIDLDSADNAFKLELPFESRESLFSVIGSCDGLLALTLYHHTSVCLWNISTRKFQILPNFWSDYDYIHHAVFDGFGYDAATDDYKWVRVISDEESTTEVTVYSLKANSWRRIENYPPPYPYYTVNGMGVLVGSALNWVVGVIIDECRVMSFDLKGEKFDQVSLPDMADDDDAEAEIDIVVFEGCLCLCYFYACKTALDVWVMKEYGVKESWTRLFRLSGETLLRRDDLYDGFGVFACSKSNNKVLVYQVNGEVFWYDLDKKTDDSIEINEWPTYIWHATIYMDSLISPKISI